MKVTNTTKTLLGILVFLIILYGATFILQNPYKVISYITKNLHQLVEASNLYSEPNILPEILIHSPVSDGRYSIKDEININFSVTDNSLLEAGIGGRKIENGEVIKAKELAIGKHTLTVKFPSSIVYVSSGIGISKEVIFTVVPLVSVKNLIGENGDFVNFIIEGLGVENIYDKNIGLIYHDKVNDTEIGLNSEDISSSIGDYDEDNLPELRVDFNKAWFKDILDTNPYAEFTLRLELNDGTILNVSSADWESQDPAQLLVVGLKDGVAAISGIDVTEDSTEEVSIKLRDEIGDVITSEPLGVASNMSNKIWVSFSDKKIRMYNSCGEFQSIDGTNPYWAVSSTPDGLDWDGTNLQYCSASTNKVYRISSAGAEEDLGVISRRLSIDGVATDSPSVHYTTQEYEGYNPRAISGNYLCSANKIDKRFISNSNLIQTLPAATPIWTNEQDTPGSCLGVTQTPDDTVPEGHVVYLSSTDGNVYKARFENKTVSTINGMFINDSQKQTIISSGDTIYFRSNDTVLFCQVSNPDNPTRSRRRPYFSVTSPQTYIDVKNITRGIYNYTAGAIVFPTTYSICTYDGNWNSGQLFNNSVESTVLWTSIHDGVTQGVEPIVHVQNLLGIIPTTQFYFRGRYGNEEQTFPGNGIGRASNSDHIGGFHFLTGNGSLTVLSQFTTSIPVPQGLAMGQLFPRPKIEMTAFRPQTEPFRWNERYVPEDEEESPGAGIRINGDDDNNNGTDDRDESPVNEEDDLIKVTLEVTLAPAPGCIEYVLKRSNSNIKVWESQNKGTAILDANDEQVLAFGVDGKKTVWIENPNGGKAFLELQVRAVPEGTVINFDKIHFFSFTSIVIALGGEGEVPTDTDPPNTDHGVFNIAIDLYTQGYDVHMYDEDNVDKHGRGAVFDEVKSAVEKRGVTKAAIFGYSHGGGSTHDLTIPLRTIRSFTISYTAYIDAVRQSPSIISFLEEERRPVGTEFLLNFYETPFVPSGGPVHPPMSQDIEINVTDTEWGANLNHFDIDDHPNVRNEVIQTLIQKVPDR